MRRNYRGAINGTNVGIEELRTQKVKRTRKFKTTFHRDIAAMKEVWRMLKRGSVAAFGEIGRQYH